MTTTNYEMASRHAEAAAAARHALTDLYENAPHERERIGALANELRDALKLAEIRATLAVADELHGIRLELAS